VPQPPAAAPAPAAPAGAEAPPPATPPGDTGTSTAIPPAPAAASHAGSRQALALLRRPSRRLAHADFAAVADAVQAPGDALLAALRPAATPWAEGGLAYAGGDEGVAEGRRLALVELSRTASTGTPWGIAWPALAFARGEPALARAALYGDARGQLAALAGAADRVPATVATAYLRHLEGDHAAAVRTVVDAGLEPSRLPDDVARTVVGQLLMAEAIELGDAAAARRWQPFAAAGETTPLVRPFLLEMATVAQRTLGPREAAALRQEACRLGAVQACRGASVVPQAAAQPSQPDRPARSGFGQRAPQRRPSRRGGGGGPG
jgi:hypothetical protein